MGEHNETRAAMEAHLRAARDPRRDERERQRCAFLAGFAARDLDLRVMDNPFPANGIGQWGRWLDGWQDADDDHRRRRAAAERGRCVLPAGDRD